MHQLICDLFTERERERVGRVEINYQFLFPLVSSTPPSPTPPPPPQPTPPRHTVSQATKNEMNKVHIQFYSGVYGCEHRKTWLDVWSLIQFPANKKRFCNVSVSLCEGLVKPNVVKTLFKRFTSVHQWYCWNVKETLSQRKIIFLMIDLLKRV